MIIDYLGHSGFLVETGNALMLFDYYRGDLSPAAKKAQDKPLFVFASHAHPDHFNPEIFSLAAGGRRVKYLLSSDVRRVFAPPADADVAFLGGKSLNELIEAERQGTEYALLKKGRMSQCITLPEVNAYTIGQLIFFYELSTAYAGELLDIDAFNQPGVEESKIASYAVLGNTSEKYQKKAAEMAARPAQLPEYIL